MPQIIAGSGAMQEYLGALMLPAKHFARRSQHPLHVNGLGQSALVT
jgi:hypothetical protein